MELFWGESYGLPMVVPWEGPSAIRLMITMLGADNPKHGIA